MRKTIITLLSLCISMAVFGQAEYNKIKKQADMWYNYTVSQDVIPKGAKYKTIDYPLLHYCVTGYFLKGVLAEGSIVEFFNTESTPKLILCGQVSYVANKLLIKGVRYEESQNGICSTYGSFYISNSADNIMIYKDKKANELKITDSDIEYYLGYYRNNPTAVRIKQTPSIAIEGRGGTYSYNDFSAPLEKESIKRIGYNKVNDLLLATSKNIMMHWNNGSFKDFNGVVLPRALEDGRVFFVHLTGARSGYASGPKSIRVYEDFGKLCMELNDNPTSQLKKETIIIADKNTIDVDSYWNMRTYLENMSEIRWEYRNGDKYVGKATFVVTLSEDGESETITETITTGKYTFSNGDCFEGDMSKEFCCGVPVSGTTYFKDGTISEGNWLNNYKLTDAQWAEISTLRFPSVVRDSARVFQNNNLYDKYIAAARDAETVKNYKDAKSYYLAAKEIKPNAEKWDDIIKQLDKQIYLETRRTRMIAKYGTTYGYKIANGVVEIGMTKDMVIDALSIDDVLLHAYRVSSSTDWSNNRIETWEYDYDMVKKYMDKEMGDSAVAVNFLFGLGYALGYNFRAEVSKIVKYKYLRFKNNKLTELKDSSFYDDIDNAKDNLNSALWMLYSL